MIRIANVFMQREVLQITHHCNKQKDCSSFSLLGEKKKLFFPESHLHPPPPDHPLWPISIVISGRSSEHMACQSSPALRGSPHPNPLGRPCIIHHVLETTRQLSTNAAAGEKREEEKQRKPPRKRNRKEAGKDEAQH